MSRTIATIGVHVTPRAGKDAIDGLAGGVLRVHVAAPPVGGRANAAVERLIARALHLPPSSVRVVSGQRGRRKTVAVDGVGQPELLAALLAINPTPSPTE